MTMTKTIGDTKAKHISLLILKISLLTLFGCGVKIHKINPIFGYKVKKKQILTLYLVWSNYPDDSKKVKQLYVDLMLLVISLLTLFWLGGYQIDRCLPFPLYFQHGFCSESEQPNHNRVNIPIPKRSKTFCEVLWLSVYDHHNVEKLNWRFSRNIPDFISNEYVLHGW